LNINHKSWNPWVTEGNQIRKTVGSNFLKPLRFKKSIRVLVGTELDFFHPEVNPFWQLEAFKIIDSTPHLHYIIPTEYPERVFRTKHAWIGLKAKSTEQLKEKITFFKEIDTKKKFLYLDNYHKPIDLSSLFLCDYEIHYTHGAFQPIYPCPMCNGDGLINKYKIRWLIVSGSKKKRFGPEIVRNIADFSCNLGIPFYYKQALIGRKLIINPHLDGKEYTEIPPEISQLK
jgi:protein gp37